MSATVENGKEAVYRLHLFAPNAVMPHLLPRPLAVDGNAPGRTSRSDSRQRVFLSE